jgi:hypothetical protein
MVVHCARLRLYAELGNLVPSDKQGAEFTLEFAGTPSIGDALASLGISAASVDLVLADSEPVELSWILRDGARVSVYPLFRSLDVDGLARPRPTR